MTTVTSLPPIAGGIDRARSAATARPGLFTRFASAFMAARQRQADREVEAVLGRSGARLTDEVERRLCGAEIGARYGRG
ncbi:hypothetical protein ACUN0C_07135 [Faunimonas sp. B44]|uniref:hypothetical protein n=1 Tax=Faunimonas sp. B44 TaxID=3461493 RepID=UPI004044EDCE